MTTTPVWVDITADDARSARDFYAGLLGWTVSVPPGTDGYALISEGAGPPVGGIGQAGPHSPQVTGVVTYFPVTDVAATVARAVELGGAVAVGPWEIPGLGRMAVVSDPEGNRIGVMTAP